MKPLVSAEPYVEADDALGDVLSEAEIDSAILEHEIEQEANRLRARRAALRIVQAEERGSDLDDWSPIDLSQVVTTQPDPDVFGMFYAGAVNSVFGPSESGKTWLALLAAREVLEAGGRVVMFDFEDAPHAIIRRLRLLGVEDDALDRFTYVNPSSYVEAGRDLLEHTVRAARLVIVDAMTEVLSAMGLSSNSDVDVAEFMAALPKWCARRGPAVVVIDHATKESARAGAPDQQGSQHKRASVSGASYGVTPKRPFGTDDDEGHSLIYVSKDKHGGIAWKRTDRGRFYGHLYGGVTGFRVVPPSQDDEVSTPHDDRARGLARENQLRDDILTVIGQSKKPLGSKNRIVAALAETGKGQSKRSVLDMIDRLVASGALNDDYSLGTDAGERF